MIKLRRGNLTMEVGTDVQASAFIRHGWVVEDDNATQTPKKEEKQYSRSEISRMSTADLKTLAPTLGIEVTEESTGAKLKEEIIEKLGL